MPLACPYGRHPRDTPGRPWPRNSQGTKHIPMSSNSSQADSAGSIPVTRSTHENCCNRCDFASSTSPPTVIFGDSRVSRATDSRLSTAFLRLRYGWGSGRCGRSVLGSAPGWCGSRLPDGVRRCLVRRSAGAEVQRRRARYSRWANRPRCARRCPPIGAAARCPGRRCRQVGRHTRGPS